MELDLSALSTEELDRLILKAGIERCLRRPEVSFELPQKVQAFPDPTWQANGQAHGLVLNFRHPGFGWITFLLQPNEAIKLKDVIGRICTELNFGAATSTAKH